MDTKQIDEERGEAGLEGVRTQQGSVSVSVVPDSPKSASTLVGRFSTSSDGRQDAKQRRESFWSRYSGSLRSAFGFKRQTKSKGVTQGNGDTNRSDDEEEREEEEEASEDEGQDPKTVVRKIHEQPQGYPMLATYLDSDENFMLYRRFGYLQSRLLLDKQEELRQFEIDLDMMERIEAFESTDTSKSRTRFSQPKKELLQKIEGKWNAYCTLLSNATAMVAMNKPTSSEQKSVASWLCNIKPLDSGEDKFVLCKEDLVTLRPGREHAWLDSGVEKMLKWLRWKPIRRVFQSKDTQAKSDGKDGTILYTRSRIENFVVAIITLGILALLIVPIWILYNLTEKPGASSHSSFECIGVLLVSTLVFATCISLFTRARRHEILGASAAYVAVLVVFIGNIGHY